MHRLLTVTKEPCLARTSFIKAKRGWPLKPSLGSIQYVNIQFVQLLTSMSSFLTLHQNIRIKLKNLIHVGFKYLIPISYIFTN